MPPRGAVTEILKRVAGVCAKGWEEMVKYILKRILWMIPVLLGVILLMFTILYFAKGDPATMILGADASPQELFEWREKFDLNDPYFVRLAKYLKQLFVYHDLGKSYLSGISVSMGIWNSFQVTAQLAFLSVAFEVILGLALGILAAVFHNTAVDKATMTIALVGTSVPGFAVAIVLSWVFALKLHLLPSVGWGEISYMVLPVLANAIAGCGGFARQTRSSMLEVMHADYLLTAKAKGISKGKLIFKHELKSALIPIVTVIGTSFGRSLGGVVVTEQVFSIPGLGTYMVTALGNRDTPAVMGSVLFLALVFSIVMLITDIVYAFVDPRVKGRFVKV